MISIHHSPQVRIDALSDPQRKRLSEVPCPTELFDEFKGKPAVTIYMAMARFYSMQELLSITVITGESGLSRPTVERNIGQLIGSKWITKTVDVTPSGAILESRFQVHLSKQGPGHTVENVITSRTKRTPVPEVIVVDTYARDGFKCVYCGSIDRLTIDHIVPLARGGSNTSENLQTLCQRCNSSKSAREVI